MDGFREGFEFFAEHASDFAGMDLGSGYVDSVNGEISEFIESVAHFKGMQTSVDTLKGDLAEFWHAGTFNIDAAVKGSGNRVQVDRSHDFGSVDVSKRLVAILTFGINSGAYVAEIIRSGIMSVDQGQFEAGRSLGLTYVQTMWYIIIPQAFKNVLPALGNEFITLLKETSICGYIALTDVTHGANTVRSQTYEPYMPLFAAALIYLVSVSVLSALISRLERRMRVNER